MLWVKPKKIEYVLLIPVFSVLMFAAEGAWAQEGSYSPPKRPSKPFEIPIEFLDTLDKLPGDLGPLPAVPIPAENPQTPEKIELGKLLFFDPRLSGNGHWACATCHNPSLGYADGLPRALGFMETELGRHTPTILNAAYSTSQFWDGRAKSLEEQAKMPVLSKSEMNMLEEEVVGFLNRVPDYRRRFKSVFGGSPTLNDAARAIAAFERTLVAGDSRFDRYLKGDKKALTDQEKKGLILFMGKASCAQCHNGPNFSDSNFHNVGTKHVGPLAVDHGRMNVTMEMKDMHAFKTPTLRNIAITPPYMHDGVFNNLEEVVDFYNKGGEDMPNKSSKIFPLNLTDAEKAALVAFMKALTSENLPVVAAPQLPMEWD